MLDGLDNSTEKKTFRGIYCSNLRYENSVCESIFSFKLSSLLMFNKITAKALSMLALLNPFDLSKDPGRKYTSLN
jgi:hypothetical protein